MSIFQPAHQEKGTRTPFSQPLTQEHQHWAVIIGAKYTLNIFLCSHATVLVLPTFRAPGCPLAAEERVQGRAGEDACKLSYELSKHRLKACTGGNETTHLCKGRCVAESKLRRIWHTKTHANENTIHVYKSKCSSSYIFDNNKCSADVDKFPRPLRIFSLL